MKIIVLWLDVEVVDGCKLCEIFTKSKLARDSYSLSKKVVIRTSQRQLVMIQLVIASPYFSTSQPGW